MPLFGPAVCLTVALTIDESTEGSGRMSKQGAARAPFLRVMAPSVADAVQSAGGLIFDRIRLGWRVTVEIPDADDVRALRVLGVEVDSRVGETPADPLDGPTALATAAALYATDAGTRSEVDAALAIESTEVIAWGGAEDLPGDSSVVSYHLSRAAQVFKAQALVAAGLTDAVEPTETFWTSCAAHVIASDLTVAG
jgi:hypothetical protein